MIVTLTLNPAFDVHCQIQNLIPLKENFATVISKEAGGKGLNVSRALGNSGVENTALIIVGKSNEDAFKKKATSPLVNCEYISATFYYFFYKIPTRLSPSTYFDIIIIYS